MGSWKPKGFKLSVYLVKIDIPYLCSTLKYEWKRDYQKCKSKHQENIIIQVKDYFIQYEKVYEKYNSMEHTAYWKILTCSSNQWDGCKKYPQTTNNKTFQKI